MDAFSRSLAAAALVDGQGFTLPGLGSIESRYVPARINHVRRVVEPPCLDLHWSSAAIVSVPTFAELLVRTGATAAEAQEMQRSWLAELAAGHAISLGDLGTLRPDDGRRTVTFIPNAAGLERVYWGSGAVEVEPLPRRSRLSVQEANPAVAPQAAPATTATGLAAGSVVNFSHQQLPVLVEPNDHLPVDFHVEPNHANAEDLPDAQNNAELNYPESETGAYSTSSTLSDEVIPAALSPNSTHVKSRVEEAVEPGDDFHHLATSSAGSSEDSMVEALPVATASSVHRAPRSLHEVLAKAEEPTNQTASTPTLAVISVRAPTTRTPDEEQHAEEFEEAEEVVVQPLRGRSTVARLPRYWRYAALMVGVLLSWMILRHLLKTNVETDAGATALAVSQDRLNRSPLDETGEVAEEDGVVSEDFVSPSYNPNLGPDRGGRSARIDDDVDRYATLDVPVVPAPVPQLRAPADTRLGVGAAAPAPLVAAPSSGSGERSPTAIRPVAPAEAAPKITAGFDPANLAGVPSKSATSAGPNEVEVVIILGSFGDAINAGRLTERLAADGLLPFVDQPGKLTRVGVSFTATKASQVDRMLERMQRDYNPNAWVLE